MSPRFVFFGTPDIAVASLEALAAQGLLPVLIVTAPDKASGRGLEMTSPLVKTWAESHNIPLLQPNKLSNEAFLAHVKEVNAEIFVVVAYGKILPEVLLAIPPHGTINMHPSLLPKHRGPSPIKSQILHEQNASDVGVSVMLLDAEMDHGPILASQKNIPEVLAQWPMKESKLQEILSRVGGELLADVLPKWVVGSITPTDQDHKQATYCTKVQKEDALIDMNRNPEANYRKILAYEIWPRAYFYTSKNGKDVRVIIAEAAFENGELILKQVIPEGKKEMSYEDFMR